MITKQITTENLSFELHLHNANTVSARADKVTVRNIPYNVHFHYEVKDGIVTETYRFVTRTDTWQKDATFKQKEAVSQLLKTEVFNYLFSYPEVLKHAEVEFIEDKMRTLNREKQELEAKVEAKQKEINDFWEANRGIYSTL